MGDAQAAAAGPTGGVKMRKFHFKNEEILNSIAFVFAGASTSDGNNAGLANENAGGETGAGREGDELAAGEDQRGDVEGSGQRQDAEDEGREGPKGAREEAEQHQAVHGRAEELADQTRAGEGEVEADA